MRPRLHPSDRDADVGLSSSSSHRRLSSRRLGASGRREGRIRAGGGWRILGQSAESKAGKGRGSGYDYLHTAVDDHSRYAFVEVHADEKGPTCAGFLARTAAHFDALGPHIERVMTDQAKNYVLSGEFQHVLAAIGARHIVTRPYRPQTNGKAERFTGRC